VDRFSSGLTEREIDQEFNKILGELYSSNWLSWFTVPDLNNPQYRFRLERIISGGYRLEESYGQYKFVDKVKPLEKLSEKELLLLGRLGPVDKEIAESVPEVNTLPMFYSLSEFPYSLVERYLETGKPTFDGDAIQSFFPDNLAKELVIRDYRENPRYALFKLSKYLSPITGKLIVLDAEEFSPGNAYFRVITEKEYLEKLKRKYGPPPEPNCYYVYYRAYGENEVIAQGITLLCLSSYHAGLKSSKDNLLALGTESTMFSPCGCRVIN